MEDDFPKRRGLGGYSMGERGSILLSRQILEKNSLPDRNKTNPPGVWVGRETFVRGSPTLR